MISKKKILPEFLLALMTAGFLTTLVGWMMANMMFTLLDRYILQIMQLHPELRSELLEAVKSGSFLSFQQEDHSILRQFGYSRADFFWMMQQQTGIILLLLTAAAITILFICIVRERKKARIIQQLQHDLYQINLGKQTTLIEQREDEFSVLRDELSKTISHLKTVLQQEELARKNYAENLRNIAHQLKTPLTCLNLLNQPLLLSGSSHQLKTVLFDPDTHLGAVSYYTEKAGNGPDRQNCRICAEQAVKIQQQLNRLNYLEDALLLMARIDTGQLSLQMKPNDVLTILCLSAENLDPLCMEKKVMIDIEENGEVDVDADLEWTLEALMNILKNCVEHSKPGSAIHLRYEKTLLFVRIQIEDEGPGFLQKDLPHLFERYYKGDSSSDGLGIGLYLAKQILNVQNALISARNRLEGGACYEIRFPLYEQKDQPDCEKETTSAVGQ